MKEDRVNIYSTTGTRYYLFYYIKFQAEVCVTKLTYTAGIHAGLAGAYHVVNDAAGRRCAVLETALGVGPDGNGYFLQNGWLRTTYKKILVSLSSLVNGSHLDYRIIGQTDINTRLFRQSLKGLIIE